MVEEGSSSSTPVDNSDNEEIPPYLREEPPEGSIMVFLFISKFQLKFTIEISKKRLCVFVPANLRNMGYYLYSISDTDVL